MTLLEIHEPGETPLPHAGEGSLAVGIDLGTTNSVVAIAREGKPAALHDETGKALVPSVVAYPAAGGVLVGDLLLDFDGHTIGSPEDLLDLLAGDRVGRAVPLRMLRGTSGLTVTVTVGKRPNG